jgi:hypothetical protein
MKTHKGEECVPFTEDLRYVGPPERATPCKRGGGDLCPPNCEDKIDGACPIYLLGTPQSPYIRVSDAHLFSNKGVSSVVRKLIRENAT